MRTKNKNLSRRAKVDPIYALIAKHLAAVKANRQANKILGPIPGIAPEYKVAEKAAKKTGDRADKLLLQLLYAKPTTLEGAAALLAHVGRPEFLKEPKHPHHRETFLSSMNQYILPGWKRHGQDFPVRLAETLRGLIAEVQP